MAYTIAGQEFHLITCYACGIAFLISDAYDDRLRKNHKTFYCPTGHSQSYAGKTEAEKLREKLASIKKYAAAECVAKTEAFKREDAANRSNAALRGHLTRLKRAKEEEL